MMTPLPTTRLHPRGSATTVAVLVVGVVAMLGTLAWWLNARHDSAEAGAVPSSAEAIEWHTVKPMTFDVAVLASGELDAKNKLFIRNEVEGKTTIIDIVDEGRKVQKDDILVRLADDTIKKEIEDTQELVQKAAADKIAAEQNLEIEKSEADSLRKADELKLALAELDLAKWRDGTVAQKRRDLELALVKARDSLKIAERNAIEADKLFKAKFISESEYDDDKLKLKTAISDEKTAVQNIEIYDKFEHPAEEKKFTSAVEEAKAALLRTVRKNSSMIARADATLASASTTLANREERLSKLKQQLAYCTLRAPTDGVVVYATSVGSSRYRRDQPIGKNRDVAFAENLIILPDTSQMVAILKVSESRIPDIEVGQKVVLRIDALKNMLVDGYVYQKATMAEESSYWNPDVRQYEVRVDLPTNLGSSGTSVPTQRTPRPGTGNGLSAAPAAAGERSNITGRREPGKAGEPASSPQAPVEGQPLALNPGMRCTGQIFVDRAVNALAVPVHAVITEGRQRFVYVPADGGKVRRQIVRLGKANELYAEIRDGLTEGDRVLLRKPRVGEILEEKVTKPADGEGKPAAGNGGGGGEGAANSGRPRGPRAGGEATQP